MSYSRSKLKLASWLAVILFCLPVLTWAAERTLTDEQRAELEKTGGLVEEQSDEPVKERPKNLPDLTKGERIKEDIVGSKFTWHLGPTGIIGHLVGGFGGDQIQIENIETGSPADGQLQWGDVILGVNGKPFETGGNMAIAFGNAIIEAEREESKGILKLQIWRDRNFLKRYGKANIANKDIEKYFTDARKDNTLYEWEPDAARDKEVENEGLKKFPVDGYKLEVTLKLRVMPPYSDTSPYDCPNAEQIREDAWKVVARKFRPDAKGKPGRGGVLEAIALVASGKPEYLKLVHDWVRSKNGQVWQADPNEKITLDHPVGFASWRMAFDGLYCAIYYDATHDDFVLPALRKYALMTAMGQAGGGSWGHTFAWPSFNGGQLHGMNPGYGAMNQAGTRCFFLLVLARKLGIQDPQIDLAIERAHKFFGSYVDQGAIPYGYHPAWPSDDSNGKNAGVAFALKLLGDDYGARYFAQMCTHASFTRRGGHGHDYFGNWSGWAATLCGPKGVIATERNMRWRRTLNRCYDGSFVYQSPTGGYKTLRDPTATAALYYSAPLKKTLITGKDPDESFWWTDDEFQKLLAITAPQFNDPTLIEQAGTPWPKRGTDQVFDLLNIFMPKTRDAVAKMLGQRYQAGEKDILPRIAKLLESDDGRFREGACRALRYCGKDAALQYMSKVARLLDDPKEFVRIQATRTMAAVSLDHQTQLAFLNTVVKQYDDAGQPPNNLRAALAGPLFTGKQELAKKPFEAGFDEKLVRRALEQLLTLDPGANDLLKAATSTWTKDTVVQLAGPIVYISEYGQINNQMSAARRTSGLSMLNRFGYREGLEASADLLRQWSQLPRDVRPRVAFKKPFVDPDLVAQHPAAFSYMLSHFKQWLLDKPLDHIDDVTVQQLVGRVSAAGKASPMPSIADEAEALFNSELTAAGSDAGKIKMCQAELSDPDNKSTFRQIAAMDYLSQNLGADAMDDLLPFVGHDYWRLREHAQLLVGKLAKADSADRLIQALPNADSMTAVGIMQILGDNTIQSGIDAARRALKNPSPDVRQAAIIAVAKMGGENTLAEVMAFMRTADSPEESRGCEQALLMWRDDPQYVQKLRTQTLAMLPDAGPELRGSLYWILGQLGGPDAIDTLAKAAQTDDQTQFSQVLTALSYSPDLAADDAVVSMIKNGKTEDMKKLAGAQSARRMVIGPNGIDTRTDTQKLDFAEPLLKVRLEPSVINYLRNIHTGRCAYILQQVLRRGATSVNTAESIVTATNDLTGAPESDRKLAVSALVDLIEYVEVEHLRGGVEAQLEKHDPLAGKHYLEWKEIAVKAGKNLLKLKQPGKAPLPEFNNGDIDF